MWLLGTPFPNSKTARARTEADARVEALELGPVRGAGRGHRHGSFSTTAHVDDTFR